MSTCSCAHKARCCPMARSRMKNTIFKSDWFSVIQPTVKNDKSTSTRLSAEKRREREMSETESQTVDSKDDASSVANHGSETPMTTDSETETEEEEKVLNWMPIVEEAMQKHKGAFQETKINLTHSGLDEQTAGETAYSNILRELQKELRSIYLQRLQWIQQRKKDSGHKKIMQTKDAFVNDDDFNPEEAVEAAVNKRKFLINRHLKDYNFTEDSDDEEDY